MTSSFSFHSFSCSIIFLFLLCSYIYSLHWLNFLYSFLISGFGFDCVFCCFQISTSAPPLHLVSPRHVELSSSSSRLVLKHNTEIAGHSLTVTSTEGVEVFSVGQEGVRLGTGRVVSHTATLGSAIQTPVVQSKAGHSLTIQSPTRYIHHYQSSPLLLIKYQ